MSPSFVAPLWYCKLSCLSSSMRGGFLFCFAVQSLVTNTMGSRSKSDSNEVDKLYPGTAVVRMRNIRKRVRNLTVDELSGDWEEEVRPKILWAGGLRDLRDSLPGQGYTGHSFNDFNHCDLTAMRIAVADSEAQGRVPGIAFNNPLGKGIRIASDPELGPGGSWSTCIIGAGREPPRDVAHIQFQSRIAFKLVWAPPLFQTFVLVDDDGDLLNYGTPNSDGIPSLDERKRNYAVVKGSKYALQADKIGTQETMQ
eukprot:m.122479 g.122479  ORF g.122479 m.122479 type:complete len:254 (-) comp14426_c0_seq1:3588-4349(-)